MHGGPAQRRGRAQVIGHDTIFVENRAPLAHGFQTKRSPAQNDRTLQRNWMDGPMTPVEQAPLRQVASFDGAMIAYRDLGGSGPALLLLPGWACIQMMWDGAIPFLRDRWRVVSLDFAGFGASTAGGRDWTMADFARDARAVIEHLDLRDVTVVGHSMGGAVALETAALCHDRVAAVIGCDTFTYLELYGRVDDAVIEAALNACRSDYATTVRTLIGPYLLETGDPELARHVADVMASARPEHATAAIEQLLRWDLDASLSRCAVPIFTINARPFLKAEVASQYQDRFAIETIDNVGHFLMMEKPEAFAAAVARIAGGMRPRS